jgi:hypothetical protein
VNFRTSRETNERYKETRMRFLILICVAVILASFGCRENAVDTGGNAGMEFLTAENVGVTDVYLKIRLPFSLTQQPITLKRDTTTILHTMLYTQDTLVADEHLLPNHTYTYTLIQSIGNNSQTRARLTINTMDTTSHNFTWEIDTLGDGNNSALYDVALVNDTCAWAVGEIYKKDSLGNWDNEPYGAARWDGRRWNLMKVRYHDYNSSITYPGVLRAVYAFSSNDIYVCSYANFLHWDGTRWTEKAFFMTSIPFTGQVNKIWGTSGSNLYCVGNSGAIYHYDGTSWEKLTSGTTTDIMDAWGILNPKTGKTEVYCPVTSYWTPQDKMILKITSPTTIDTIAWGTGRKIFSVWSQDEFPMFTAGDGVFENRIGSAWHEMNIGATIFTNRIRGSAINDVFVVGDLGLISHYNGLNFNLIRLDMMSGGGYGGLAVNDRLIIAVGGDVSCAIIAIGKR